MTDQPRRIQRQRAKGWRMPDNTIYVGKGSQYGNPFRAGTEGQAFTHKGFPSPIVQLSEKASAEHCLDFYIKNLHIKLLDDPTWLDGLRGKNLACWCPLDHPCHADVLLQIANFNYGDPKSPDTWATIQK